MYAVIVTGGKQYKVAEGEYLKIEKLEVATGESVTFDRVLLVANGDDVNIGAPVVAGATVKAEVISQGRHDKVRIIKFRRRKHHMLVLPRLSLRDTGVWRVMKQMLPAIIGVSVSQISLIINTIFASFLVAGSVSWMYYADRLMELPSGVLGVALGTILLPTLAKTYASKDRHDLRSL